jgi:membrane protein
VAARSGSADPSGAPDHAGLGRAPFLAVLRRAFANFRAHQMTDRAATLTYNAMMSLFPALLLGVTLLGLVGERQLVEQASDYLLRRGADRDTASVARTALDGVISASGSALGLALVASLVLALNGASGAFGAAGRALNVVYGVEEDRGLVRRKLTDAGCALAVIVLLAVVLVAVFLGGQIAEDLFGWIGLGSTAAMVWSYARWPVALLAAIVAYAIAYGLAPDITPRRVVWISPGAAFGVTLWIVLSIGFAVYIRNFSRYGAAYGAFGAAIVLLLWLYLSANAFLFGAEVNAELERARRAAGAAPPFPMPPPIAHALLPNAGRGGAAGRGGRPGGT